MGYASEPSLFSCFSTVFTSPVVAHRCMPGTSLGWRTTLCGVAALPSANWGPWHPATATAFARQASRRVIGSGVDLGQHDRRHPQMSNAWMPANGLFGHLEGVLEGGRRLETEPVHDVPVGAHEDDVAGMLHGVRG